MLAINHPNHHTIYILLLLSYKYQQYYHLVIKLSLSRTLTGDFLSIGLMINFLSLNEMLRISLQGNPIFGVSLNKQGFN